MNIDNKSIIIFFWKDSTIFIFYCVKNKDYSAQKIRVTYFSGGGWENQEV